MSKETFEEAICKIKISEFDLCAQDLEKVYNYQQKKIQDLEAKLSKATQELRHTLDRFCVLEGDLQDEKLTRLQIKGMVEAIEKTLEEIEKGE